MGNSQDQKSGLNSNESQVAHHGYTEGYHILKVQAGGPGEKAGLKPYFDFIVAADGVELSGAQLPSLVEKINEAHQKNACTELTILNTREDSVRKTNLYPSHTWGGTGLIGISIRPVSLAAATEFVWHILEVMPNSPAADAQLQAFADYIVGTPVELFKSADDFYALVENEAESAHPQPIEFYVFNSTADTIRTISITPNPKWGGSGSLGCNVGFGLLHRIPLKKASSSEPHPQDPAFEQSSQSPPRGHHHREGHAQDPAAATQAMTEDMQICLQLQIDAARAKRLAAEQEEAELQFRLSQLHNQPSASPDLPQVEPFPFDLQLTPSPADSDPLTTPQPLQGLLSDQDLPMLLSLIHI